MIWFGKKKEEATAPVEAKTTAAEATPVEEPAVPEAAPAVEPVPQAAPAEEKPAAPSPAETAAPVAAAEPAAPVATAAPAEQEAKPAASAPAAENKPAKPNAKALYYSLMNALYDAVVVVDNDGHLMDCNERVTAVFGYSHDETWYMPLTQLIPGMNARVFAQMKEGLHGNHRVLVNARCRRKDGTTFPGEVGAGLMSLMGENLVISIRNIEKRAPAKALVRPAASPNPPPR